MGIHAPDYGGEKVDIWREMANLYGEESKSVVVGSSVHNQRIECHNRSVNKQVIQVFKQQFYELENQGILDPSNSTDLYCLHFIFLPRLNRSISEFIAAHNNHALSTEENLSALQLFLSTSSDHASLSRDTRACTRNEC